MTLLDRFLELFRRPTDMSWPGKPWRFIELEPTEFSAGWQPVEQSLDTRDIFPGERQEPRL